MNYFVINLSIRENHLDSKRFPNWSLSIPISIKSPQHESQGKIPSAWQWWIRLFFIHPAVDYRKCWCLVKITDNFSSFLFMPLFYGSVPLLPYPSPLMWLIAVLIKIIKGSFSFRLISRVIELHKAFKLEPETQPSVPI